MQAFQKLELVQLALFLQQLRPFVCDVWCIALTSRNLARKRREMPTTDVVVEVGGRKQNPPI